MKTYKNLLAIMAFATIAASCDHDETVPRAPKAIVKLTEETVTVSESGGSNPTLTFTQDIPTIPQADHEYTSWYGAPYPEKRGVEMRVEITGGTAKIGEDFEWTPTVPVDDVGGTTVNAVGFGYWGGDGLYYWLPPDETALEHTVNLSSMITVINDGISEGKETIELRFYPAGQGLAAIDDTLTITIED